MIEKEQAVYLTRVDASANYYRYYSVRVDPDLFGRWSLIRQWGRLDYDGGAMRIDSFETEALALGKMGEIVGQKRRRGYFGGEVSG